MVLKEKDYFILITFMSIVMLVLIILILQTILKNRKVVYLFEPTNQNQKNKFETNLEAAKDVLDPLAEKK